MRAIILLVLLTLTLGHLVGQGSSSATPSASQSQEMLRVYLSARNTNARPLTPAVTFICPAVPGIPIDAAFRAKLKSLMVMDEVIAGDCSRVGGDLDSLSFHGRRQVLAITSFVRSERRATITARAFGAGGMHEEVAFFSRDLGWVLDSLTLKGFVQNLSLSVTSVTKGVLLTGFLMAWSSPDLSMHRATVCGSPTSELSEEALRWSRYMAAATNATLRGVDAIRDTLKIPAMDSSLVVLVQVDSLCRRAGLLVNGSAGKPDTLSQVVHLVSFNGRRYFATTDMYFRTGYVMDSTLTAIVEKTLR